MTGRSLDVRIGAIDDGVVIVRTSHDGQLTVDFPGQRRYRVPHPANLDGVHLAPVRPIPATMDSVAGWYESPDRRLLLTQVPEAYFGEPMVLLAESDQIMRAYPVGESRLLADDGTEISLTAGGLTLTAGGTTVSLARSSRWREEPVTFEAGGGTLAGTVVVPASPGPHPAAVLVHGAAGGQRDFCRLQAQPLLEAGVAVLIYDKAGHGRSGGPTNPSIFDQAAAAEAGLALLAAHADIDPRRVGLAGFSNGMWAVPMVAARRPVAFVVGIGAPGVSMAASEVHRRTKVLRECGVSETTIAAVGEAWQCIFDVAGTGRTDAMERLDQALAAVAQAPDLDRYEVPGYVVQNPMLSAVPPMIAAAELAAMLPAEADPQLVYDPATDYARISCPVFLQYGSDDTSVPVAASVRAIVTGGPLTVRVYPGLEHMLNIVPMLDGLSAEESMFQFHSFRFGPDVWRDLIDWLDTAAKRPGMPEEQPTAGTVSASLPLLDPSR